MATELTSNYDIGHYNGYARAKRDIVSWLRWKAVEPGLHPVSLSSAAQMIALGAADGFADRKESVEEQGR